MKKKFLLLTLMILVLTLVFAISASAEGSSSDAFGTAETLEGIPVDLTDTTSRVVLKGSDNLYRTFPSSYIYFKTGSGNWNWRGEAKCSFDALNAALGLEGDDAYTIDSVIRIEVPDDLKYLEGYSGKANLKEMYFSPNSQMTNLRPMGSGCGIEKITLPPLQTSYATYMFHTCPNLTTVIFNDDADITSLPTEMFKACTSLEEITIPEGVTSLGVSFFSGCTSLKRVNLPSSLKSVGTIFSGLTALEYVNTEHITSFSAKAFQGCSKLNGIVINNAVTSIPNDFCKDCSSLTSIVIPENVTIINGYAFNGCTKLTSVTNLSEKITTIAGNAFASCPMTEFNFPDLLTTIGASAFIGAQFTEIDLPSGVTSLGQAVFQNCTNLSYIKVPEGVTQIPHDFRKCTGTSTPLTIVVPKGCTSIYSQYSLQNCNITSIIFTGTADSDFVASVQSKASSYVSMITYANHCEIYYGGTHAEDTHPCLIECTRCGMREQDPNAVHTYNNDGKGVINYANGFISSGTLTLVCENEGCECNLTPSVTEVESIYKCLGFSSSMADPTNITLGYVLNKSAYDAYLANDAENVLSFGFVAFVTYDEVSCAPLTVSDGEVTPVNSDITIFAELNSTEYVAFDFIIRGFSADTMDLGLVMCAYTFDGNEIKYMSRDTEGVFGSYDVAYSTTFSKET